MTAIAAAILAASLLATGGIARALPLVLLVLTGIALIVLGWALAAADPVTSETCRLAGTAAASAVVPLALWREPERRIALAIAGLALPLAAYALATSESALAPGLVALLAAGFAGQHWRVVAALAIAAIAGGAGLEYPGLAAAMPIGLAAMVTGRWAPSARLASMVVALPCLLPIAATLAARSPWLLLPLAAGLLPLIRRNAP